MTAKNNQDQNIKKRLCYVVCYRDPDYIRTKTLTAALALVPNTELLIIKNKNRGILRYLEVPPKLLWARMRYRPDIFVVGFRGHEIFWALYPAMAGKKIVFDEFINIHDWLVNEHSKLSEGSRAIKILDKYVKWIIKKSSKVLEDTNAHAELSLQIYKTPQKKLTVVPVGADEDTFYPRPLGKTDGKFEIFFYGSMLPLHGLEIILESISQLHAEGGLEGMHFTLVGGKGNPPMTKMVTKFIKLNKLSNFVAHIPWVEYSKLPDFIAGADLCLGGPFGNTSQARRVITGKTYQFLAMAKPTIVGRNQAHGGFIDKKNSLVVELGSQTSLAQAVAWAYQNQSKLKAMGSAGRELYLKNFSTKTIADKLETGLG